MKKVLFISYLYPPIANSGTQRSLKFANYLHDEGWMPIILTVKHPPESSIDEQLLDEVRPYTRIERVPFWSYTFAKEIARRFGWIIGQEKLFSAVEWRVRLFWRLPDMCNAWRYNAVKRATDIYYDEGFDLIYASGAPWTSFMIAHDINKRIKVPYVLDYRDLWTHIRSGWDKRHLMSPKFNNWVQELYEKKAVSNASGIISVSAPIIEKLKHILKVQPNTKFACITNGFDYLDYSKKGRTEIEPKKLVIAYTGVWKEGYSPESLYRALALLVKEDCKLAEKISIHAAGFSPGKFAQYNLEKDLVKEYGHISHSDALNLMQNADLLFLPVAEGEYAQVSLPGKLFEYLGSGTPILASVPVDSEVNRVLKEIGGAIQIDPGDYFAIKEVLLKILLSGNKVFSDRNKEVLCKFERKFLTRELAIFFNRCVSC